MPPFLLERYFARYEFQARFLLSASDCESLTQREVLDLASPEALGLWENLALGYTESAGHPRLREAVAGLYRTIQPEDVLVAAPEEAILLAMLALLSPGDEVVVLEPAYQSLHEIARWIGCRVHAWRLAPESGGWALDLDGLKSLLSKKPRLLVVNFPNNPTGYLPARGEFAAILQMAERSGVTVFSDEMYRGLEYSPDQQLPAACDRIENCLSLSGMSKAYSLPGLRIGWLATRSRALLEKIRALKDYTTICSSAPSEILSIAALGAGEQILARNQRIIQDNLEAASACFARRADLFTWYPPRAGSVAFPAWNGAEDVGAFCQRMVAEQGVMVVPGSLFDGGDGHFRIGLGRRNFREALARFESALPK